MTLRLIRNLSQTELAESAGVQSNQVSRYEKGTVHPQPLQLAKLLDTLGVGFLDFFYVVEFIGNLHRFVLDRRLDDSPYSIALGSLKVHAARVMTDYTSLIGEVDRLAAEHDRRDGEEGPDG